jgi:ATP-dependent helicase/DNAse subunit B
VNIVDKDLILQSKQNSRMILFLDIDGVMVHGNPSQKVSIEADGFYRFSQAAVDAINLLLDKSNIIITLTTSHRFRYNEEEWKTIFFEKRNCYRATITN